MFLQVWLFAKKSEWPLCRCTASGLAVGMWKHPPPPPPPFQLTIYVAPRCPWHQNLDYTNGWRWVVTNTSTQRGGSPDKKRDAGDRGDESWRRRQTASLVLAVVHRHPGEIITWHAVYVFPVRGNLTSLCTDLLCVMCRPVGFPCLRLHRLLLRRESGICHQTSHRELQKHHCGTVGHF